MGRKESNKQNKTNKKFISYMCISHSKHLWVPKRAIYSSTLKKLSDLDGPTIYSFLFSGLTYKYIVIHQPVGRQLFRMYCDTKPDLKKAIGFLDEIVSYFFLIRCTGQFSPQSVYPQMGPFFPRGGKTNWSSQECIIFKKKKCSSA